MEGSTLRATLLTLAYAADKHGDRPWMDTTLNADARAALLLKAMTEDEKFQMLHSYFGLGRTVARCRKARSVRPVSCRAWRGWAFRRSNRPMPASA